MNKLRKTSSPEPMIPSLRINILFRQYNNSDYFSKEILMVKINKANQGVADDVPIKSLSAYTDH